MFNYTVVPLDVLSGAYAVTREHDESDATISEIVALNISSSIANDIVTIMNSFILDDSEALALAFQRVIDALGQVSRQ